MDNDKSSRWNFSGDEDPEPSSTDIFQKRSDFFQSFMADRLGSLGGSEGKRAENNQETDDDDEDEKSSTTSKKPAFKGFLKPFLPDAEPESVKPANIESSSADELKELSPATEVSEEAVAADITNKELEHSELRTAEDSSQSRVDMAPTDETDGSEELSSEDVIQIEHENHSVESPDNQEDSDPVVRAQLEPDRNYIRYAQAAGDAPYRSKSMSSAKVERAPGEDRGGGALLAFLGAEFLSRRRDRKLSKEIKTQEKVAKEKLEHLKRSQLTQKEAQESLRIHQQKQIDKLAAAQAETSRNSMKRKKAIIESLPDTRTGNEVSESSKTQTNKAEVRAFAPQEKPAPSHAPPYEAILPERKGDKTPEAGIEQRLPTVETDKLPEADIPMAAEQETLIHGRTFRRKSSSRHISPVYGADSSSQYGYYGDQSISDPSTPNGNNHRALPAAQASASSTYKQAVGVGVGLALLILLLVAAYYYLG